MLIGHMGDVIYWSILRKSSKILLYSLDTFVFPRYDKIEVIQHKVISILVILANEGVDL